MSDGSPLLERKVSSLFDAKLQRQKKDDADLRVQRERQQSDYATRQQLQQLFSELAEAAVARGPPGTEAEAQKRLFLCLARRKHVRESCKKRIQFRQLIEVSVQPQLFFQVQVVSSAAGDVQLTMRNVMNHHFVIDDQIYLSWEQYDEWERLLAALAMLTEEPSSASTPSSSLGTIRADGVVTAAIPPSSEVKKALERLWNLSMELRQSAKRVGVFQPL